MDVKIEAELKDFRQIENFRDEFRQLSSEKVVYIFLYHKNIKRLVGSSPILKIGETLDFKKRMARYFNEVNIDKIKIEPRRQTAYRLRRFFDICNKDQIKLLYKVYPNHTKEQLKNEEKKLLKAYLDMHFEVPPLNMGLK